MCAEPSGTGLAFVIQLVVARARPGGDVGVSFNGAWPEFIRHESTDLLFAAGPYSKHVEEHLAWNYAFDPGSIREGWNEIVVYNESAEELDLIGVELGVIKRKTT